MDGKGMSERVIKASESAVILAEALGKGEASTALVNKEEVGYGLIRAKLRNKIPVPEMHQNGDDMYFITAGKGTVYLGGKMMDTEETSAGEYVGKSLKGGTPTVVEAGDIVSIPRGTPHMMGCPEGKVEYYIVKI